MSFITYPMAHRINRPAAYVPSCATDIKKTFDQVRERQEAEQAKKRKVSRRAEKKFAEIVKAVQS